MRKSVFVMLLAVVLLTVCLSGCGSVNITSVSVPAKAALEKGETFQLDVSYGADRDDAEAVAKAAESIVLVWHSSDEAVASVGENGLVTAIGGGTAEIAVSVQDTELQSTCRVAASMPVAGIEADDIVINTTQKDVVIEYVLLPQDAGPVPVTFAVADESVAGIKDGKLTVLAAGETELTIMAGDVEKTVSLTVQQAPERLFVEDMSLTVGETAEATVDTGFDAVEVGTDFTYRSDDEEIATIDENGVITAIAAGTATVAVENELGQGCEFTVTVTAPVVQVTPVQAVDAAPSVPAQQPSASGPVPEPVPAPAPTPAPASAICPTCRLEIGNGCLYDGGHTDSGISQEVWDKALAAGENFVP